jgi:hypothetical protein
MGSTPNRAIPYTNPGDPLAGYPAQDQAQAERLDALLFDTGWVACITRAGFAPHATDPPQVRRIGSAVYARGAWLPTGMTINNNNAVGDLPAGFYTAGLGSAVIAGGSAGSTTAQPTAVVVNLGTGGIIIRTSATLPSWVYLNALTYFLS